MYISLTLMVCDFQGKSIQVRVISVSILLHTFLHIHMYTYDYDTIIIINIKCIRSIVYNSKKIMHLLQAVCAYYQRSHAHS